MVAPTDLSTKFALDVQAVNGLRIESKKTGQAGLEAAAKQFEALFLNMLLKSMREATPQEGLMDSDQSRLYTSMLDQQLSQTMAARGVGLAEMMIRQLRHAVAPDAAQKVTGTNQLSSSLSTAVRPSVLTTQQPQGSEPLPPDQSGNQSAPAPVSSQLDGQSQAQQSSGASDFIGKLMGYAKAASRFTGIPAPFMIGQAALESAWGKRELRMPDGSPSHNLFGIKAGSSWKGKTVETVTTEYVNGAARKVMGKFRAYDSYADAFRDYSALLRANPRYAGVMAQAAQGITAEGFAHGLQQAGYATDPNYADKLSRIIRKTKWS